MAQCPRIDAAMQTTRPPADDSAEAIARDVAAVGRISAVPALLAILCQHTGMGFAAVARVTDGTWTACAVQDNIGFGLLPGGQLDVRTTLCREAREALRPITIDHASADPVYRDHHTPRIYNIESYVSVPIVLAGDVYFGNLCAIDPRPVNVSQPQTVAMFTAYAALIARQLDTENRQEVTELELAGERAQAQLREQFIAVLGHDLRNPLAAVGASADMMLRPGAVIDVAAVGGRIKKSVRRMARLIDDVLDFTRGQLGSGIGVQRAEEPQLNAALEDVIAELCQAHPLHCVTATLAIDRPVLCDRSRIQQLLSNLLGNAMHHGAAGEPIVVEAVIEGGALVLSVANQGSPIAPEHLVRIFEPYWRPPSSRPGGGLGLGLHICAQIVKAHGGRLEAFSSAEAGTRFVATIPLQNA
ncbi:HAMP domain-containing sensor histidine kinase [soil metagenome]